MLSFLVYQFLYANNTDMFNSLHVYCNDYFFARLCAKLGLINQNASALYVTCMWWWLGNVVTSMVADAMAFRNKLDVLKDMKAYDFIILLL